MYLYAGPERRADLIGCLSFPITAFNLDDSFDFRVHLSSTEVDVLRGGAAHDLLRAEVRGQFMWQLGRSMGLLITAPSCNTHTRVRHSSSDGPRSVRDAT